MISLYTMELHPKERSVYFAMNAALRDREREAVKVWRSAIWLLVTAMNKLPREKETVLYRGVKKAAAELGRQCEKGKVFLWCGFSSTTSHVEGLQAFLGTSGPRTKWTLKLRPGFYGVDIRLFSFFPKEFEVLLPPQLEFEVKSVLDCGNGFIEVQCVQLEETDPILDFVQAQVCQASPGYPSRCPELQVTSAPEAAPPGSVHSTSAAVEPRLRGRASKESKTPVDVSGWNLHGAAKKGEVHILKALLDGGADKERKNQHGETPLHMAAEKGQVGTLKELLAAGAEKDARTDSRKTPLHVAAEEGQVEALKELIVAGAEKEAQTIFCETPLHLAAEEGQVGSLKELIAAGAKKEAVKQVGETPLHLAARKGQVETLKELLAAGAEKEARNIFGQTPADLAREKGHAAILELLEAPQARRADLSEAIHVDVSGWNLHEATKEGKIGILKALLDGGADKDMKNKFGEAPLHVAAEKGQVGALKELLSAGAAKDVQKNLGETALHVAAEQNRVEVLKELLAAGAAKEVPNYLGATPLHGAARYGQVEAIQTLVAAGVAKEVQNTGGETPLHWAARFGQWDALKELLAAGAAKEARNHVGETPLHVAAENGHLHILKELLAAGAAKEARSNLGTTPAELARANGHAALVELLDAPDGEVVEPRKSPTNTAGAFFRQTGPI
ncbi:unnamed protein product [Durusdinium trenchii]|uniref:ADP ribosyltransferase domain-containing protein n=1 Tax=Durusdinium trenchii TaxID=1381693 RepID=A0ABP0QRG1_9DINO